MKLILYKLLVISESMAIATTPLCVLSWAKMDSVAYKFIIQSYCKREVIFPPKVIVSQRCPLCHVHVHVHKETHAFGWCAIYLCQRSHIIPLIYKWRLFAKACSSVPTEAMWGRRQQASTQGYKQCRFQNVRRNLLCKCCGRRKWTQRENQPCCLQPKLHQAPLKKQSCSAVI